MDYVAQVTRLARVRRAGWAAWSLIGALLAAGLAVRLVLARPLDTTPFAPFIPALPVAALICGWRKALVLLGVSLATSWCVFVARGETATLITTPSIWARFIVFLSLGGFLIALAEMLGQAVQRLDGVAQVNAELFRELQHRVANNFQIVAATLQKARRNLSDPVAVGAIDNAIARIESLSRLHRRLYDPAAYEGGLAPILGEVLAETFRSVTVEMRMQIDSDNLSVGQMTTIVLLVNEAAINAAKHVFAPQRGGRFTVTLAADGRRRMLTVADDGPGFQVADGAPASPRYGLAVMRGLAAQLGGALEVSDQKGATIRVAFTS